MIRQCDQHYDCRPGTGEWRAGMAALLGIKNFDDPTGYEWKGVDYEGLCDSLDKHQVCPLCVLNLEDKAKKSPKRNVLKQEKENYHWIIEAAVGLPLRSVTELLDQWEKNKGER